MSETDRKKTDNLVAGSDLEPMVLEARERSCNDKYPGEVEELNYALVEGRDIVSRNRRCLSSFLS